MGVLTDSYGAISDGYGIYSVNVNCAWTIQPPKTINDTYVYLSFVFLDLDYSDFLYVYDGTSSSDPLLSTLTSQSSRVITVNTTGSSLYVEFVSDYYAVLEGFVAYYYTDSTQSVAMHTVCPENCNNHGACVNGTCECDHGWVYNNCNNDDPLRLEQMYRDFNTSSLADTLGWGFNSTYLQHCHWTGIFCSNNRVDILDLSNFQLENPPTLLPYFLETLRLRNNSMTGTLPSTWSTNNHNWMWEIDIGMNQLSGTIGNMLADFPKLVHFMADDNHFSGALWKDIWRNSLDILNVANNNLTGRVPDALGWLIPDAVALGNNLFFCPIPTYSSLQPTDCLNVSMSSVSPAIGLSSGFVVTVSGENFLPFPFFNNSDGLKSDWTCVIVTGEGNFRSSQYVPARRISETTLSCDLPPNKAGSATLSVGYADSTQASWNSMDITFHPNCPAGTYLRSLSATACDICPTGGHCAGGAAPAVAAEGHYPSAVEPYLFYECGLDAACPGGGGGEFSRALLDGASLAQAAAYLSNPCAQGYAGFLCSHCEPGYHRQGSVCNSCPPNSQISLQIFLLLVPVVIGILLLYKTTTIFHLSSTAVLLEFVQTTGLFLSFSLSWSPRLLDMLNFFSLFNFNLDYLAIECAFPNTSDYFNRFIIILFVPLMICIMLLVVFFLWKLLSQRFPHPMQPSLSRPRRKSTMAAFIQRNDPNEPATQQKPEQAMPSEPSQSKGRDQSVRRIDFETLVRMNEESFEISESQKAELAEGRFCCANNMGCGLIGSRFVAPAFDEKRLKNNFIDAFTLCLVIGHIPLSHHILAYFECVHVPDRVYMSSEPDIECYSGDHAKFLPLAVVAVLVYVAGIPVLFFSVLRRYKSELTHSNIRARFGSIFRLYKGDCWYWELIIRARVLLLCSIPIMFPHNGLATGSACLLVFVAYTWVDLVQHPFVFLRNNFLSAASDFTLILLLFSGIVFTASPSKETELALASIIAVILATNFALLIHGVIFESLYYFNDSLCKYRIIMWLIQSKLVVAVFRTDRSYVSDFNRGLESRVYFAAKLKEPTSALPTDVLRFPPNRGESFYDIREKSNANLGASSKASPDLLRAAKTDAVELAASRTLSAERALPVVLETSELAPPSNGGRLAVTIHAPSSTVIMDDSQLVDPPLSPVTAPFSRNECRSLRESRNRHGSMSSLVSFSAFNTAAAPETRRSVSTPYLVPSQTHDIPQVTPNLDQNKGLGSIPGQVTLPMSEVALGTKAE